MPRMILVDLKGPPSLPRPPYSIFTLSPRFFSSWLSRELWSTAKHQRSVRDRVGRRGGRQRRRAVQAHRTKVRCPSPSPHLWPYEP